MKIISLIILIFLCSCATEKKAPKRKGTTVVSHEKHKFDLSKYCFNTLKKLPGKFNSKQLTVACSGIKHFENCVSSKGEKIYHFDKIGENGKSNLRILVVGVIHGDEALGGAVSRAWMERLTQITPRNHWRILPIANPDGLKLNKRTNFYGVDINRNFPTSDWNKRAKVYWQVKMKGNPRRYPGRTAASEKETKCIIKHIKNYNPDLIIAIHTPLGVMDFDGPRLDFPKFKAFPWISLGNYPGSLGRYMWRDRKLPVLTIELLDKNSISNLNDLDKLQDISGLVAIMTKKYLVK